MKGSETIIAAIRAIEERMYIRAAQKLHFRSVTGARGSHSCFIGDEDIVGCKCCRPVVGRAWKNQGSVGRSWRRLNKCFLNQTRPSNPIHHTFYMLSTISSCIANISLDWRKRSLAETSPLLRDKSVKPNGWFNYFLMFNKLYKFVATNRMV